MTVQKQPYKVVEDRKGVSLVGSGGEAVAHFPVAQKKVADSMAKLPLMIDLFHKVLDGVDGYLSEFGDDNRYWDSKLVDRAWAMLEQATADE